MTERTVHLVTAVAVELADHTDATAASVEALRAALGELHWRVRWIACVDGPEHVAALGPADRVIHQPARSGVSACRNAALAVADDGWVFRLDADDELDIDGWVQLVEHPRFGAADWCATNVTIDGEPSPHWFDDERDWPRHSVAEAWSSPMPFHPNNVVARTRLAHAAGGWPALRTNEDIGYVFALNQLADGNAIPAVTLRYRRWEHQSAAAPSYPGDRAIAFTFLTKVTNARRAAVDLPPISAPEPAPTYPGV